MRAAVCHDQRQFQILPRTAPSFAETHNAVKNLFSFASGICPLNDFGQINLQGICDPQKRFQGRIPDLALNKSYHGA